MRIVELSIQDDDKKVNLDALSLVEQPAIQVNFIALSADHTKVATKFASVTPGEKHMVYGPALIPNKLILRKDDNDEYYQCYFNKDTVEKCANIYMSKSQTLNTDHDKELKDAYVSENWLVTDPSNDKANAMGFKVPEGTWMCGVKIQNDMVWEEIKAGQLNGFSIEGFFTTQFSKYCMQSEINDDTRYNLVRDIYVSQMEDEEKIKKIQDIINGI
jgi:hypothetical protein